MKSSVNTTTIFKYILLFTFLFAAFLALAITYNRVFKQKNEILSIIEKYEGVSSSVDIINNYLSSSGYTVSGHCENGEYGVKNLSSNYIELANSQEKYAYCLSNKIVKNDNGDKIYYNLRLFYKFNLPFIGDLLTFEITGETKAIKLYNENKQKLS